MLPRVHLCFFPPRVHLCYFPLSETNQITGYITLQIIKKYAWKVITTYMCDHVYCFQKKSAVYAAIVNFQSIIEKTVQKLP